MRHSVVLAHVTASADADHVMSVTTAPHATRLIFG
jgi:hypothetical protein